MADPLPRWFPQVLYQASHSKPFFARLWDGRGTANAPRAILKLSGIFMHTRAIQHSLLAPAKKRWSRSRAQRICPRKHLRVLPTRTRPSLFGGD